MEHLRLILDSGFIPFLLSARQSGGDGPKINWPRLMEMAFLAGVVYATISAKFEQSDYRLAKIEAAVEQTQGIVGDVRNEQSRRTPMIKYIENRMNK